MKDNYTFPVVLDYNEKGYINILFPSFENGITCIDEGGNPILEAQNWLALTIVDFEEEHKLIPDEANDDIILEQNQKLVYVNVWMPYHRTKVKEVYVKKTLTIPMWLDILAKSNNINFSSVLVKALQSELSIK